MLRNINGKSFFAKVPSTVTMGGGGGGGTVALLAMASLDSDTQIGLIIFV
jgi:hypothetical protein